MMSVTQVYIGECESFLDRVKDHQNNKSFWHWAIVCTSSTKAINKADVKYLESLSLEKAINASRYEILNKNIPSRNTLHEFSEASIHNYFEDIKLLISALGFNIFEPLKIKSSEPEAITDTLNNSSSKDERLFDTLVAPCKGNSLKEIFIAKNAWHEVRISKTSLDKIKYVALYESTPIKAIRYYESNQNRTL